MAITIKLRRGTAVEWSTKNPTLATGEPGYEIDTGKCKFGDGFAPWNDRPYFVDEVAIAALIAGAIASSPVGGGVTDIRIGNLANLTTTAKATVVGAINEVNTPSVPLTSLYSNAKAG